MTFSCYVIEERPKSLRVGIPDLYGALMWLPKSQVRLTESGENIQIPRWLARENGLVT